MGRTGGGSTTDDGLVVCAGGSRVKEAEGTGVELGGTASQKATD